MEQNLNFLKWLAEFRNPVCDILIQMITRLSEEVIVIGIICLLYWCINKNIAYKIGLIFFSSGILVQGLKISFRIDRPWILDSSVIPVESAIEGATGYSFPSGHTQSATALYGTFITIIKRNYQKIILSVIVLLIAFSRLYLGVHTPLDVVVSFAVTIACLVVISLFFEKIISTNKYDFTVTICLSAISLIVCVLAAVLLATDVITTENSADCIKSGGAGLGFALGWFLERKHLNFETSTPKKYQQIVKLLIGAAIALLIKEGLKHIPLFPLVLDFVRYFLVVVWALYLYPMIFTNFFKRRVNTGTEQA